MCPSVPTRLVGIAAAETSRFRRPCSSSNTFDTSRTPSNNQVHSDAGHDDHTHDDGNH
jgi:hypothetical protein